jgi:thiosulfate dehydrogenase
MAVFGLLIFFAVFGAKFLPASMIGKSGSPRPNDVEADLRKLPQDKAGMIIRYGYALITDTASYIGPDGKVGHYARNKMACANCHLGAGTRKFGNSWFDSHALYPQFRVREGKVQTLAERTNTCFEHNMRARPLPEDGPEMKAILFYYRWLGSGRRAPDPGLEESAGRFMKLEFLKRAADPSRGRTIYKEKCSGCHGGDGAGRLRVDGSAYQFPPLWGAQSFSLGTSMSRLSVLARFVKANMPYRRTIQTPELSDDQAWDVSAFILSQPRPPWSGEDPFPILSGKPFDYPIGPFADRFPPEQHRLGPFQPIVDFWTQKTGRDVVNASTGI